MSELFTPTISLKKFLSYTTEEMVDYLERLGPLHDQLTRKHDGLRDEAIKEFCMLQDLGSAIETFNERATLLPTRLLAECCPSGFLRPASYSYLRPAVAEECSLTSSVSRV
jgi:hypothetical protein